jgi:hypothetical protein
MGQMSQMDHSDAVQQMAAERYLLNELTPEQREAFEEHVFDCHECALDLRAAAAFMEEAKAQLPALVTAPAPPRTGVAAPSRKRDRWFFFGRPAFAVPAFAALLVVIGFQNFVTLPGLRSQADSPRLLAWAPPLHGATRGAVATVNVDREHGVALPIDVALPAGAGPFASYGFELIDAQNKTVWTGSIAAPGSGDSQRILLAVPGSLVQTGTYTIAITGVELTAQRTLVERIPVNFVVGN